MGIDSDFNAFNDRRVIDSISKIVNHRKSQKITHTDGKISDKAQEIRDLHQDMSNNLVELLTRTAEFVRPSDGIFFLLEARRRGMLEEAESVMETCYNNWIYTSREGLKRALRESEDMPMIWNILAGGYIYEGGEGNNVPNTRTGPSVDINTMRDGMGK